jgi:hypothetical protein
MASPLTILPDKFTVLSRFGGWADLVHLLVHRGLSQHRICPSLMNRQQMPSLGLLLCNRAMQGFAIQIAKPFL